MDFSFSFWSLIIVAGKGYESKSLKYETISLRRFDLEELERATKNFSQDFLLGSGAFGNVYKGTFDLEGTLAIKRAHSEPFLSVEEFRNGQPLNEDTYICLFDSVPILLIAFTEKQIQSIIVNSFFFSFVLGRS